MCVQQEPNSMPSSAHDFSAWVQSLKPLFSAQHTQAIFIFSLSSSRAKISYYIQTQFLPYGSDLRNGSPSQENLSDL
jgi:hypothetical protein